MVLTMLLTDLLVLTPILQGEYSFNVATCCNYSPANRHQDILITCKADDVAMLQADGDRHVGCATVR